MKTSAFKLGEHLNNRSLTYKVSSKLWKKWDLRLDLSFNKWTQIKFLNDKGDGFNPDISKVPNKKGGLYLFFVKCNTISGITEYPFYIGRAQLTKRQNLRKRVREYYTKFAREDERPKITKMFNYWGKELHLAFIEIDDNKDIIELEKKIINSLLLPMNDEIPDKKERQAVKAFQR